MRLRVILKNSLRLLIISIVVACPFALLRYALGVFSSTTLLSNIFTQDIHYALIGLGITALLVWGIFCSIVEEHRTLEVVPSMWLMILAMIGAVLGTAAIGLHYFAWSSLIPLIYEKHQFFIYCLAMTTWLSEIALILAPWFVSLRATRTLAHQWLGIKTQALYKT